MTASGASVIIAAYRAHDTIVRAVESLLAQSRDDWQAVIAADDGTDYESTISAAGIYDPRLTFTTTGGVGTGAASARNAALTLAARPFITVLDADDRYEPQRLARLLPAAEAHGAAVDNVAVVRDEDNTPLSHLFAPGVAPTALDADAFLATSVPMFPLARRDLVKGWEPDIAFSDDVIFNIQLIDLVGEIKVIPEPLYEYRQRAGSITFAPDAGARAEACYCRILSRLAGDGLGIGTPAIRQSLAGAIDRKRQLNAAYEAAFRAGRCANFQEFLTLPTETAAPA